MKTLPLLMLLLLLASVSCNSPQQLVQNNKYDLAIEKLSRKLLSSDANEKSIELLNSAYHTANQRDHDSIRQLRLSGQPENWPEIFWLYEGMNNRQKLIRKLPEQIQVSIDYRPLKITPEMQYAKEQSEQFLETKARALLKGTSREDGQQAFSCLEQLKKISPDYPGLDALMRKSLLQGTDRVLVLFDNSSGLSLPNGFIQEVMDLSGSTFLDSLPQYDLVESPKTKYDYLIYLRLTSVMVTPEKVAVRRFIEKGNTMKGSVYEQHAFVQVMADSINHDSSNIPVAAAVVTETTMTKTAFLEASVDFVWKDDNRLVFSTPVRASSTFNYSFATIDGDHRACSAEYLSLATRDSIPFPGDHQLVVNAARQLNVSFKTVLGAYESADKH